MVIGYGSTQDRFLLRKTVEQTTSSPGPGWGQAASGDLGDWGVSGVIALVPQITAAGTLSSWEASWVFSQHDLPLGQEQAPGKDGIQETSVRLALKLGVCRSGILSVNKAESGTGPVMAAVTYRRVCRPGMCVLSRRTNASNTQAASRGPRSPDREGRGV